MHKVLFFILLLVITGRSSAQDKSNKGKEFWLGYGNNILFDHDYPFNNQTLVLYLSAEKATDVTVTVNGTSWSRVVHIPANKVDFGIELPKSGPDDAGSLEKDCLPGASMW
ncbi:MAG: hypothetical protein ABIQ31_12995 [Ferruginibacter sp.]